MLQAGDGVAALQLLAGRKIDMAVCAVNMPRMGGIEFVKAAKALPAGLPIPAGPDAHHGEPAIQEGRRQGSRRQGLDGQAVFALLAARRLNAVSKPCLPWRARHQQHRHNQAQP